MCFCFMSRMRQELPKKICPTVDVDIRIGHRIELSETKMHTFWVLLYALLFMIESGQIIY